MHEFTCAYCGNVKQVRYPHDAEKYCSRSCAAKAREKNRAYIRDICIEGECIFQPESIMCGRRECENCGWNPVVAKARLEKIMGIHKAEPNPIKRDKFGTWISCEERLPKDKVQVLALTHVGKVMCLHCENGRWKVRDMIHLTHWMPMPDAPEV